jgi:uncharacterized protein
MNSPKYSQFFFSNTIAESKPPVKLLFGIFIMLLSYLTVTLISLLLFLPLYSISWGELNRILSEGLQNADVFIIRYFQICQTFGLFIIPAFLMNYILFRGNERFIAEGENNRLLVYLLIFLMMILSIPIVSKMIEWNNSVKLPSGLSGFESLLRQLEDERNELTVRMLDGKRIQDFFFNLFMVAVLPALGEEFIFRGFLQQILTKWWKNMHIAIFISAFLFSAIHLQFYGFFPRLLLGLFFGYLLFWSRNIWWSVWAHFVNNAVAVTLLFMSNSGQVSVPEILKEEHHVNSWEFIISLSITILLVSLTFFISRKNMKQT